VQFALDNGGRPVGRGENYLAVCEAAGDDVWTKQATACGRAVLAGRAFEFSLQYPCDSETSSFA
jgi:hypothetical protein